MNEARKKGIILVIIGAILATLLVGLFVYNDVMPMIEKNKESNKIIEAFYKKYNAKERNIIYYAKDDCSYCKLQTPILDEIAEEYDLKYYYVNSNKLTKRDIKKITNELDIKNETPITIIVEDGEVVDTQVGYLDGSAYTEFLKKNEILDSDAIYPGEKLINFVSFDEYKKIINASGKNIVVIGQTGCSHCTAIKPALNQVASEYDITINYLNLTDLKEEENSEFYKTLDQVQYNDPDYVNEGSFGTPLTLILENGKVIRYISGERTPSGLVREFTKAGIIE